MSARLHVRVGRGVVSAKAVLRRRIVWAAEARFAGPDDLREAIAQLAGEESLPIRLGSMRVKLEPPLAQIRTLEGLPPVRAAALRALVSQQAGRFFRKNGKPLVTDAVWIKRSRGQAPVARAAAVEEPWVEAILAGARESGLMLEAIRPQGEGASLGRLTLLSPAERARRWRTELLALKRLALIAALLWVAAAVAFLVRLQHERAAVERELHQLSQPALAIGAAHRKLTEAARMVETIARAERERARMLVRLDGVTAALPDSVYLTSLTLDDSSGTVSGLSQQAVGVLASFERRPDLASPRLVGPVIRETNGGRELERFTLSFSWGARP